MLVTLKKAFFLLIVLSLFAGCALIDQNVNLRYEPVTDIGNASGEVLISKKAVLLNNTKKSSGEWIIGTVRNGYGIKTADVVTINDPGDWIMNSIKQEIERAGYKVNNTAALPMDVQKGLDISIIRVFVDQDPGFWTVGAISDIQFNVEVWKNGVKTKTFNVVGKGDDRSMIGSAGTKEMSLLKGLQAAMKDAVPQIISELQ